MTADKTQRGAVVICYSNQISPNQRETQEINTVLEREKEKDSGVHCPSESPNVEAVSSAILNRGARYCPATPDGNMRTFIKRTGRKETKVDLLAYAKSAQSSFRAHALIGRYAAVHHHALRLP